MRETLHKLKPAASRGVHLLLASLTWTIVGAALLAAGLRWSMTIEGAWLVLFMAGAVSLGVVKARFALRRAALRVVDRIVSRGDDKCIGGFFSWRTWLFVLLMSGFGRILRLSGIPTPVVGFIYTVVGLALLIGSWWLWRGWCGYLRQSASRNHS